ncbi:MAG: chemotaxis protein CheA [Sphingomonadales bacterium]|nr:chemotaxis protein CheA [Sphingomonadales bacterium]
MDLDAIQQMFFQESEEGLQALESCFGLCREAADDAETINTIFRAVHSIKGGAGAFGHEHLQDFAHHYEGVLDQLRSGTLTMTPALLDVLLAAFDTLSDHVAAARGERGTPEDTAVLAALAAVSEAQDTASESTPVAMEVTTAPAAPVDDFDALLGLLEPSAPAPAPQDDFDALMSLLAPSAAPSPAPAWHVSVRPSGDAFANGGEPLLLLRELVRMGGSQVALDGSGMPSIEELDVNRSYLGWTLEMPVEVAKDDIEAVFEFVDGWQVEIVQGAAQPEAETPPPVESDAPQPVAVEQAPPPAPVAVSAPVAAPEPTVSRPAPSPAGGDNAAAAASATIRVELDKLDRLVNLVGELVITQAMLAQRLSEHGLTGSSELTSLENLTRELQESAMSIRAQPMKTVFNRVPRIIRELEADTGKRIRLQLDGEMTEVDKTVVERIGEPLTHLIRNAVDHGIESPEERLAAGKSEDGVLRVGAEQRSGRIVITVADDGRGIDRARVRAKAVERGIVAPDAILSDEEVDNLIFAPGFSTAEKVSNISGRGVGMDVVRRNVQALGGRIGVSSRFGSGASFTLSLPLTLAVLDGMIVKVGEQTFVVPLGNIVESLRAQPGQLSHLADDAAILDVRGVQLPVLQVGALLGIPAKADPDNTVMIVVDTDAGQAVIMVDTIEDQRQVVVKSLEANYRAIPGVSGATILGDGRVALILDVEGVLAGARRRPALAA